METAGRPYASRAPLCLGPGLSPERALQAPRKVRAAQSAEAAAAPDPKRAQLRDAPENGGVLENWPLRRATSFCSKHKYYNRGRPKPWFRVRVAPARKVLVACHPGRPPIFHELDVRC